MQYLYLLSNHFVQFVNIIEKDIVVSHGDLNILCLCFFFDFCAYDFSLTILLLVDFVVVQLFSCFNKLKNGKTLSVLLSAANRMQSNGAA